MARIKQKKTVRPKHKTVETRIKDLQLIEMRRKQIAEGAIKVFVAKGYHKATVREIVEASGLPWGRCITTSGLKKKLCTSSTSM